MPPFPVGQINQYGGAAPFSCAIGTFFTSIATGPGAGPDCACVLVQDAGNSENSFFGFNTWPPGAAGNPTPGGLGTALAGEVANTTNAFFNTNSAVVANTFQTWAAVALTSTSMQLYFNGVADNTFSGAVTYTGNTQGQVMYNTASINSGQTFGNGIVGAIPYFAMWGRQLSAAEFLLLHQDPFCFLIYPEDEMLSMLVGALPGFNPYNPWSQRAPIMAM